MKNLIVCADGTWNTPDQEDGNIPAPSNVVLLHRCLAEQTDQGVEQKSYYHPGVGTTGSWYDRFGGGAYGRGISDNIMSAYHWLSRNYDPGDRIYLFGFSRGAYTVRSLAGMIACSGLLELRTGQTTEEGWKRVGAAYDFYREVKPDWRKPDWALSIPDHKADAIHFLGVWDTVGALGVPNDLALLNLFDRPRKWMFHDTELGKGVSIARHAVALDEMRASFTPTLWTNTHHDLKQVWFPGVHSDVGGGYVQSGLSDGALLWMIEEASSPRAALAFRQEMVTQIKPDPFDLLHDSNEGLFKVLQSRPRAVPKMGTADRLHPSVEARRKAPPLRQPPYRRSRSLAPGESTSFDAFARERWNETTLYLEQGLYQFKATGQWLDKGIPCPPAGADDGHFHAGEVVHVLGSALGWVENLWRRRNDAADFKMTRRFEQFPWFALIGSIAHRTSNPGEDGSPPAYEQFAMASHESESVQHRVQNPGYLFAFANDAWDFYDNNRGSVQVEVTRLQ